MKKYSYSIILIIILIIGNFLRNCIENANEIEIEVENNVIYKKIELKNATTKDRQIEKYDINSISYSDLINLGFTKSRANKIVNFRENLGIITDISECERISRIGDEGFRLIKNYFFVDKNKIYGSDSYKYYGSEIKNFNINKSDKEILKLIGFSNKEIKKITPLLNKNYFKSNLDLEEIIGKERYQELSHRIRFHN